MERQSIQNNSQNSFIDKIKQISSTQRKSIALKSTQYISRIKLADNLNLRKLKTNLIENINEAKLQKIKIAFNQSLTKSFKQFICQCAYLIYSCALYKVNLIISKSLYITEYYTLMGVYYLPCIEIQKNYDSLKSKDKGFIMNLEKLCKLFYSQNILDLQNSINQMNNQEQHQLYKHFLKNQSEGFFFNFQFKSALNQNQFKQIILAVVKYFWNMSNKIGLFNNLPEISRMLDDISKLQVSPKMFPTRFLSQLQKQINIFKSNSFLCKYQKYSFEKILLNNGRKLQQFVAIMKKQQSFYENVIKMFEQEVLSEGHFVSKIKVITNPSHHQINTINRAGKMFVQDTFFKSLKFLKSTNSYPSQQQVVQSIQYFKRFALWRKSYELINIFQFLLQKQLKEEFFSLKFSSQRHRQMRDRAKKANIKQATFAHLQINKKLNEQSKFYTQNYKQCAQNQQSFLSKLISINHKKNQIQIPIFQLEMFERKQMPKVTTFQQTIEYQKADSQCRFPIIEVFWIVKYLVNLMSMKQSAGFQFNNNLIAYFPGLRLICPQRIKREYFEKFQLDFLQLRNQFWQFENASLGVEDSLDIVYQQSISAVILQFSVTDCDLNQFIQFQLKAICYIIAFYSSLEKVLNILEAQSAPPQKNYLSQKSSEENTIMYNEEIQILKVKFPHQIQLVNFFQYSLSQKIIQIQKVASS